MCSPFDAEHLSRGLSTAQNGFWTHRFWCLLVLLRFLFHLFHISKIFPFEDFLHQGKQTKVTQGKIWSTGRMRHRGHAVLGQTPLDTQHSVGRCAHKSPIMKWANVLNLQKKKSLKPNTASHSNASWCTGTNGFLEHSPTRGSLYVLKGARLPKDNSVLGGSPSYIINATWFVSFAHF